MRNQEETLTIPVQTPRRSTLTRIVKILTQHSSMKRPRPKDMTHLFTPILVAYQSMTMSKHSDRLTTIPMNTRTALVSPRLLSQWLPFNLLKTRKWTSTPSLLRKVELKNVLSRKHSNKRLRTTWSHSTDYSTSNYLASTQETT